MFSKNKHNGQLFRQAFLKREQAALTRRRGAEERSLPWGTVLLWSVFALVGFYMLCVSPVLSITDIRIEGESVIPQHEYHGRVEREIRRTLLKVVRLDTFFLIPEERIKLELLRSYPKLSDVQVERHFPDTLVLTVSERPAILLWCAGGPCYALREGRAVKLESAFEGRYDVSRYVVVDQSAVPVTEGEALPVEPYLLGLEYFASHLEEVAGTALAHEATTPSRHSSELRLKTSVGWDLMVSVERPFSQTLNTLELFLTQYDQDYPNRTSLTSIDLRVEGKVFYSDGQGTVESVPLETAQGDLTKQPEEKKETKKPKKRD